MRGIEPTGQVTGFGHAPAFADGLPITGHQLSNHGVDFIRGHLGRRIGFLPKGVTVPNFLGHPILEQPGLDFGLAGEDDLWPPTKKPSFGKGQVESHFNRCNKAFARPPPSG